MAYCCLLILKADLTTLDVLGNRLWRFWLEEEPIRRIEGLGGREEPLPAWQRLLEDG